MPLLKYIVEDSTIAALLGEQNFTNKESAILELVKNAYDAQSPKIIIQVRKDLISVSDSGIGMDETDIRNNWMHVGKSEKEYIVETATGEKRILAGSKGIGRFALARLGEQVTVYSRKKDCNAIKWVTDWDQSSLTVISEQDFIQNSIEEYSIDHIGTDITITFLRDKWTRKSAENLADYLSRAYNDTSMEIELSFEDNDFKVSKYFAAPKLGDNCVSIIAIHYDSEKMKLNCTVESNEFKEEAANYYSETNLNNFEKEISIFNEYNTPKNLKELDINDEEDLKIYLQDLGDFRAEFYFSIKSSSLDDYEKFLYQYRTLPNRYNSGVILYRNAFSISSHEGKKDWLGFGKRSRLSPAAASHTSGSWRVRENQIAGKIEIDKLENNRLQDLSNRQGLDENIYYQLFVEIILQGINAFERYRQGIIRAIDKKNTPPPIKEKKIVEAIIDNPSTASKLSRKDAEKLAEELVDLKSESENYKEDKESAEEKHRYDVRILNVLSTSGLKAMSIAHELHNDRNSVAENYERIVGALKALKLWDILSDPKNRVYAYQNVPAMLNKNKYINQKLTVFMDTMLSQVEKSQFVPSILNVFLIMQQIKKVWQNEYDWISIEFDIEKELNFYCTQDVFKVIFDNLILNSIQQNSKKSDLKINAAIDKDNDTLLISYEDNGIGLPEKYVNDPKRILEVHESSRENGHGLGMWIVNNTVLMSGGKIKNIMGKQGFRIEFTLGDQI